jgi:hypothetical protein
VPLNKHEIAAPDRAPEFLYKNIFAFIYLNVASGAPPQQGVAAPDGRPEFIFFVIHLFQFI